MRTRIIIVSMVVVLLALPAAVYAQPTDPQGVTEGFVGGVNNGNVDEAMAFMDPAATANSDQGTGSAEAAPEYAENPQQTYSGEAEVRAWMEGMVGMNPDIALGECAVDGETVTCPANYVDDAVRAIGVEAVAGTLVLEVSEAGMITSYAFTPTAESVAAVQAAAGTAPTTLPESGGVLAQATDPQVTVNGFTEAVNKGDVNEAMTHMDPAATATTDQGNTGTGEPVAGAPPPPVATDPAPEYTESPQQTYTGEEEVRGWLEGLVGLNANINLAGCQIDGEKVTCNAQYADDALRVVGVEAVEGALVLEVSEGAITAYSFAPTAEAVAAVEAAAAAAAGGGAEPAPEALPATGGGPGYIGFLTLLVLGGFVLAGGLVYAHVYAYGSRR